jgi:hypothetical protein
MRSRLKSYHIDAGYNTSAFDSDRIKRICKGIQKVHPKRTRAPRKQVTFDILETIIEHCENTFDGLCMRTALCVAFAGFLRGQDFTYKAWGENEQVSKPTRSSIQFFKDHATLTLPYSKTDQLRRGTTIDLLPTGKPSCPVTNLRRLFTEYPAPGSAPLFGRSHPRAASKGVYFSPTHFADSLSTLLLRSGIDPAGFTGHSIRRGATQTAADAGLNKEQLQFLGRWKSNAVLTYVKPETAQRLSADSKSSDKFHAPRLRRTSTR